MIASHRSAMSRGLIIIGLAIAAVGSLWPWITRLGLGRLAGEIFIQRDNFQTLSRQISIGNFRLRFSPSAATIHEQKQ
jgi:Protein of unknown function (DUF2905)